MLQQSSPLQRHRSNYLRPVAMGFWEVHLPTFKRRLLRSGNFPMAAKQVFNGKRLEETSKIEPVDI